MRHRISPALTKRVLVSPVTNDVLAVRPPHNGRYEAPSAYDETAKPTPSPPNAGTGATAANLPHTERESIKNNVLEAERNPAVTSQKHTAVSFPSELANIESETETQRSSPVNQTSNRISESPDESPRNRPEVAPDFLCEACLGTGKSAHFLGRCRHCAGAGSIPQRTTDITA